MPIFVWKAETRKGDTQKGEIDAADEAAVKRQLRRQGYISINVKKKPKDLLEYIPFMKQKISERDVVVFARIFATMINAGLPLIQCLSLLQKQEQNRAFAKVIGSIKEEIEGGSTLTDALKKFPKVFDDLFVNLVAAGESGGILDVILQRLSGYMEKSMKLRSKVKGAMTYPVSVLVVSIGVVAILLLKVIPVFQKMFEGMGSALPGPTQFIVDASQFAQDYFLYMVIGLALIVYAFKRYYATEQGTLAVDGLVLRSPVFGPLLKKVAVAKFTRTLSTMMASGVPILEGLSIVSRTSGNKIIEMALMKTRKSISEGKTIAEPLMETDIFYDDEVDAAVDAMTALLEPVMMVFLGGLIGGMIIAMYLPIFQMAAAAG
jgi:type IV pilus assembly protein PilC